MSLLIWAGSRYGLPRLPAANSSRKLSSVLGELVRKVELANTVAISVTHIFRCPTRTFEVHMPSVFWALLDDESGQGLVEYALIIALVGVGLIAILLVLRNSIGNVFKNAASQLNNATVAPMAP